MSALSKKHQKFADEYLKCFNQTQAYLKVYPKSAYESAAANAVRLIGTDNVRSYIADRLQALQMSADEALKLLAEQARGDIGEVMDIYQTGFNLDMAKAKALGLTKLIKRVRQKTTTIIGKNKSDEDKEITELEVELYDAQNALDKILRVHGKYNDKIRLEGGVDMNITKAVGIDTDKL